MNFNIEDLNFLTDDDLHNIIYEENLNHSTKTFFNKYESSEFLGIKEHVFGEFWKRIVQKKTPFSDKHIDKIIKDFNHETWGHIARNVLGEAAIFNLLSLKQCLSLSSKEIIKDNDWTFRQISARIILFNKTLSKEDINLLIILRTTWAIVECLVDLDNQMLVYLQSRMQDDDILTRRNRDLIIKKINEIVKLTISKNR